jgi:hypothetical protein
LVNNGAQGRTARSKVYQRFTASGTGEKSHEVPPDSTPNVPPSLYTETLERASAPGQEPPSNKSFDCPFDDLPIDPDELSPHALARVIAGRLESLGYKPFASDKRRYAVILDDSRLGEIVDLGKPLKGQRFFPTKSLARNIETLRQFKSFALGKDAQDWRFWSIKKTGCKANTATLVKDVQDFNSRINTVFSDCRKHRGFKPLLIVIHIRYDHWSGLIDLHGHFVCQIPPDQREAVAGRLTCAFSKVDVPDEPIQNLAAVITYCLWGIYRLREMVDWPPEALSAVWNLSQTKPRLVRACGAFQKWRREHRLDRTEAEKSATRRRRGNRRATRYHSRHTPAGDRLLTKAHIRLRGERVEALIFEEGVPTNTANTTATPESTSTFPSATRATTQEHQNETRTPPSPDCVPGHAGHAGHAPGVVGASRHPPTSVCTGQWARAFNTARSLWRRIRTSRRLIGTWIRHWLNHS